MIQPPANLVSSVLARVRQTVQSASGHDFYEVTFRAMSTPVRLAFCAPKPILAQDYQKAAIDYVARFEARYSRFISESIIGQINAAAGDWNEIDEEADHLFGLCDEMHAMTGGIYDPTTLPLLRLWDWKANPPRVPDGAAVSAARDLCGWDKIQRRTRAMRLPSAGMGIDLGGIGKEFAIDHLHRLARERGMTDVLIDIGQDLRVRGQPPGKDAWYIGLEEPDQPGKCWTALRLTDHAIATSGDYFRSFTHEGRRYGHILDPRTGQPVCNNCQAVSVIAPSCVLAGILSTAAFILGPLEGLAMILRHSDVEACITTDDARHQTRRFSSYAAD